MLLWSTIWGSDYRGYSDKIKLGRSQTASEVNTVLVLSSLIYYCGTLFFFTMLKIISWNCRGAKKNFFLIDIMKLIRIHCPDVIFIMETLVESDPSPLLSWYWNDYSFLAEPSIGRSGGWIFGYKKETLSFVSSGRNSMTHLGKALSLFEDHIAYDFLEFTATRRGRIKCNFSNLSALYCQLDLS